MTFMPQIDIDDLQDHSRCELFFDTAKLFMPRVRQITLYARFTL